MKIAIGSDERTRLTDYVIQKLQNKGLQLELYGALSETSKEKDWPVVSAAVATQVALGHAEEGILFCWTGTGASIAANKIPGIRAALCHDAETARGARVWNHANILVMSLRKTSEALADEILESWNSTAFSEDEWNMKQIQRIKELDQR